MLPPTCMLQSAKAQSSLAKRLIKELAMDSTS